MYFSRAAFLASDSGRRLRNLLADHLQILDGMEVQYEAGAQYGHIDYTADGEPWRLYPVMPEWCSQQMSLY